MASSDHLAGQTLGRGSLLLVFLGPEPRMVLSGSFACDSAATFHCGICGRWFCAAHAEDETWHTCEPGDEGGEA
jgi:hypothetical protein